MKRVITIALSLLLISPVTALGSGKSLFKAKSCTACHGPEGKKGGAFPKLAGKKAADLEKALLGYKAGEKRGPMSAIMIKMVKDKKLTNKQIKDISLYLASVK